MLNRARHPASLAIATATRLHERVAAIPAGLEGNRETALTGSGIGAISTTVLACWCRPAITHQLAQTRHYMSTIKRCSTKCCRASARAPRWWSRATWTLIRAAIRPNTRLIMLETPANRRWC